MTGWGNNILALLTPGEMARADLLTIKGGTPGIDLMAAAGKAVADVIVERFKPRPVIVLCGPGNNGGDGFVIARLLNGAGWPVRLALWGSLDRLSGDAALAAADWPGEIGQPDDFDLPDHGLIVDALFGAGLSRPIEGDLARLIEQINTRPDLKIVSVDIPSGIDGETGELRGVALEADISVTFFRAKPGHFLFPGRQNTGELVIADIGIQADVLDDIRPACALNRPDLWLEDFPVRGVAAHKYTSGAGICVSGGVARTGAARLAAMAMLRAGTGVVSVASPPEAVMVNALHLTAIMVKAFRDEAALSVLLEDKRLKSAVAGPGLGLDEIAANRLGVILKACRENDKALVLDADGLTLVAHQSIGWDALPRGAVLTPHEGEFRRLFPGIDSTGSRLARARQAAGLCGHVVVLKGADSVIAHPDGRAAVNDNAPEHLATAGSGDVLAGIIGGLMAQAMPPFEAAMAGVWMHGSAASGFGPGLIAEDLPGRIPAVLKHLNALKTPQTGPV